MPEVTQLVSSRARAKPRSRGVAQILPSPGPPCCPQHHARWGVSRGEDRMLGHAGWPVDQDRPMPRECGEGLHVAGAGRCPAGTCMPAALRTGESGQPCLARILLSLKWSQEMPFSTTESGAIQASQQMAHQCSPSTHSKRNTSGEGREQGFFLPGVKHPSLR